MFALLVNVNKENVTHATHNASVLAHAQRLRVQNSIIQYLNEILV